MGRLSRVALWTMAAGTLTATGCANLLGFQEFTADGGAGEQGSATTTTSAGTTIVMQGGTTTLSSGGTTTVVSGTSTLTTTVGTSTSNPYSSTSSASALSSTSTPSSSTRSTSSAISSSTSSTSSRTTTSSSSSSSTNSNPPGKCTWGTAVNGSGSFTWYYFGQGTYMQNGQYKTACGYNGTESGMVDTVSNIANSSPAMNSYFAAIPGSNGFNTVTDCGACIEITNGGNKIVATVIDECPTDNGQNPACAQAGHLDLSYNAWKSLGYSVGNPSGTTWKFVPCPVTGDIVAVANSSGQYYLQNSVFPISSVNGQAPTQYGYFNVMPGSVSVTSSVVNQTITINIPSGGGNTGSNFVAPSGCY